MKNGVLKNWKEFEDVVQKGINETESLDNRNGKIGKATSLLYRGQSNSIWKLESVLERSGSQYKTVDSYFKLMLEIWFKYNSEYQVKWPNLEKEIQELDVNDILLFRTERANSTEIINFMVHLRHHGFISPLLDWTENPLIAAYFAFESIPSEAETIAIYQFREHTGYPSDMKELSKPNCIEIGNNIPGIDRHKNQESHYTLCVLQDGGSFKKAQFANMEKDINNSGFYLDNDGNDIDLGSVQNVVRKYTIPVSERNKVIKKLHSKNINRCFLFGDTEDNRLFDFWTNISVNGEQ